MSALAPSDLLALFGHFLLLSLLSIGGAMAAAPDMHRLLVRERGWLDDGTFTSSVALAQAAPGPNVLFVAVLGFNVAGVVGALVVLTGILLPSTVLALAVSRRSAARPCRRARPDGGDGRRHGALAHQPDVGDRRRCGARRGGLDLRRLGDVQRPRCARSPCTTCQASSTQSHSTIRVSRGSMMSSTPNRSAVRNGEVRSR